MRLIILLLTLNFNLLAQNIHIKADVNNPKPVNVKPDGSIKLNLNYMDLRGQNFSHQRIEGNFDYTDLSSIRFKAAHINWGDFKGAYVEGANFRGATGEAHFLDSVGSPKLYGCQFHTIKSHYTFSEQLSKRSRGWFDKHYKYIGEEPLFRNGCRIGVIHVWKQKAL